MYKTVTFKGEPVTLVGRSLKIGQKAADFRVVSAESKEVRLGDLGDKFKVITTFLSLDTRVCDLQVKEFEKRAAELSAQVAVIGISKDLPFAQKRFCGANEIKQLAIFSDYRFSSFGLNYGLLVKELNLLARSILILDRNNILRHAQIVGELSSPPDYAEALEALKEIMQGPQEEAAAQPPLRCQPCEGGVPALAKEKIEESLAGVRGWQLVDDKKLVKALKFKDFAEAKYFLDLVSLIAEEQGHHPNISLAYNKLKLTLTTHAAGGLTENDFIMAKIINEIGG